MACWVCDSTDIDVPSVTASQTWLPADFAITDAHYGRTAPIHTCKTCGFRFCPDVGDATPMYAELADTAYEDTRAARSVQAAHLVAVLQRWMPRGRVLDVGAGSGILVEQLQTSGYAPQGVDPSAWLVEAAQRRGLPVVAGVFPHPAFPGPWDAITLVDVLEHVHRPVPLLTEVARALRPGGIALVVTPDVGSHVATRMGARWWHFRVAHIGYFNRATLERALQRAGLEPLAWIRPTWYFPVDYLAERVAKYVPLLAPMARIRVLRKIQIPLNLFDSWLVVARRPL